jgi:Ulp1 family protease
MTDLHQVLQLYYQATIDMYLYMCDLTVSRYGGFSVYNTDMATLDENQWVSDTIVDVLLN